MITQPVYLGKILSKRVLFFVFFSPGKSRQVWAKVILWCETYIQCVGDFSHCPTKASEFLDSIQFPRDEKHSVQCKKQSYQQHSNFLFVVALSKPFSASSEAFPFQYKFIKCTTLKNPGTVTEGRNNETWYVTVFCVRSTSEVEITHPSASPLSRKSLFLDANTENTLKAWHNTNAQKAHCFPNVTSVPGCSLHDITVRRAAGLRGYFCRPSCLPVLRVDDWGSLERCMVEVGAKFGLTARQSMVKVDVAQVFRRSFWQTHFVVVVDHPPTNKEKICEKQSKKNWIQSSGTMLISPSFLLDVTNIVSRHCGCSHVADESKELITWRRKQQVA